MFDTSDPYVLPGYPVHYFSEGNDLSMHTHDYPDYKLTLVLDTEMRDALYVDDQFEMYVVYFAGNPNSPNSGSQRPLGKVPWNRGGLVVFDPPIESKEKDPRLVEVAPNLYLDPKTISRLDGLSLKLWFGSLAPGVYHLTDRRRFEIGGPWTKDSADLVFVVP